MPTFVLMTRLGPDALHDARVDARPRRPRPLIRITRSRNRRIWREGLFMSAAEVEPRRVEYDDDVVRAFSIITIVWGAVALLLGVIVAS